MSTTLIPHLEGEPRKGTWWRNKGRNFWGCPKCGQAHEFHHQVNEDGSVMPSMVCGKCDFHDYVTLDEVAPECVTAARQNVAFYDDDGDLRISRLTGES